MSLTNGRGFTTTTDYTPAGFVAAVHQPTGAVGNPGPDAVTSFVYDEVGNAIQVIDPRGNAFATTIEYDAQNRPLVRTSVVGGGVPDAVTTTAYDAVGNALSTTDAAGRVTTFDYDAQNRVVRIVRDAGSSSSPDSDQVEEDNIYDAVGNLVTSRGFGGAAYVTHFAYDKLNRLVSTTDAAGQVAVVSYDRWGNVLESAGPDGDYKFAYDDMNRKVSQTDHYGATTTYAFAGGFTARADHHRPERQP